MIRNNQNGRRRGRGGARPPQAGGGPSGNYANSGGNRMDVRQRGNATQLLEKYKALARDATQGGDRVQAEYFMQYADHYYRVLNEFRARDPQPVQRYDDDEPEANYSAQGNGQNYSAPQNYAPPQADGRYADEVDDDEGDDEAPRRQAAPAQNGGDRQNDRHDRIRGNQDQQRTQRSPNYARDDQRDNGQRENVQRDSRDNGQRDYQRDNGSRDSNQRDGSQRDYAPREAAPRENGQRDNSQRDNSQQRDNAPRETAPREAQSRDNGKQRDGQERYLARTERPARDDRMSREDRNGDASANDDARNGDRQPPPRAEPTRDAFAEPLIMTIPGLPGPATVVAAAPSASSVEAPAEATPASTDLAAVATDEAPAPRRRGRPRKVVVVADESTSDA